MSDLELMDKLREVVPDLGLSFSSEFVYFDTEGLVLFSSGLYVKVDDGNPTLHRMWDIGMARIGELVMALDANGRKWIFEYSYSDKDEIHGKVHLEVATQTLLDSGDCFYVKDVCKFRPANEEERQLFKKNKEIAKNDGFDVDEDKIDCRMVQGRNFLYKVDSVNPKTFTIVLTGMTEAELIQLKDMFGL